MRSLAVLEFATKAHEGQYRKYGSNIPYINHPKAVAEIAVEKHIKEIGIVSLDLFEVIRSVAYLHDVIEDTTVTESELRKFLTDNVDGECAAGIFDAVLLLTKKKENFDLFEYLDGIKPNYWALLVKLADLEHNMSDLKDKKKLDYYRLVKYYLTH
jgi:(p)ppGpp synthase/HD superfamily hydrolase